MENTHNLPYSTLLYYCYTNIADAAEYREQHNQLCISLNLLGRIIVAPEGLNGTVSGLVADCEAYMAHLKADTRFAHTDFKIEYTEAHAFRKLNVRLKAEIVNSGLVHINPANQPVGIHLEADEFKELKQQEDVVLLDVRSKYEHDLGHFKGAIRLDIGNFREFPEKVKELEHLKNKKVITYCTGGIKCEKASAFLLEQGFENVYQLHGGIIKYGLDGGGEDFDGKCYVFDGRVATEVNTVNPAIVSKCHRCESLTERMVNCANPHCNAHILLCDACCDEHEGTCSQACHDHPERRAWDGTGFYPRKSNGYDPTNNSRRLKFEKDKLQFISMKRSSVAAGVGVSGPMKHQNTFN